MIDGKTRQKLLDEIRKLGNVFHSCQKVGVDKATYYRWRKRSKKFKEEADEAVMMGRENISDIAEYKLLQNVKEGNQRAIEYTLGHNSDKYKKKNDSKVLIVHRKEIPIVDNRVLTLEDLIDQDDDNKNST